MPTRADGLTLLWLASVALAVMTVGCSDASESPPDNAVPWPYQPYQPTPIAAPLVDGLFVQETNHKTNELEPGIGPLVAVLIPPSGAGYEMDGADVLAPYWMDRYYGFIEAPR